MYKKSLLFFIEGAFLLLISNINIATAQTDGTLTFTYTQTAPSAQATKNIMAVWIEDNAGTFIKTKMRYWGGSTTDHLPSWVSNSASNLIDATTGATRTASTSPTAFGSKTINWDGKGAVSGLTSPDGVYKVMIESSYCTPEPANGQHWLLTSFSFTKGATAVHITPTGDANFSGITIDWVPTGGVGIQTINEDGGVSIYPNPSNGIVNIDVKHALSGTIRVENIIGAIIYEEKVDISNSKVKIIDLSKFANGTYFVKIQDNNTNKEQEIKVVLNK